MTAFVRRPVRAHARSLHDPWADSISITSPKQLPGLFFWVRADLGTTVVTGVSSWADQSGNGINLTQATGANQPALHASGGANNQAFIQWTAGSAMSLDHTGLSQIQPNEGFVVMHQNAASTSTDYILDISAGGSNGALNVPANTTTIQFAAGTSQNPSVPAGDHLINVQWNGAASGVGIDGASLVTSTIASNIAELHAGQAGGLTTFGMNGSLYEIIIYGRILTVVERNAVKAYVRSRYALSIS